MFIKTKNTRKIKGNKKSEVKVGNFNRSTKIFTKPVLRRKHYMHVVGGYGLQLEAFEQLRLYGAIGITILEKDTGDRLISDFSDWEKHGKVADYGHGKQIFLSEKYFDKCVSMQDYADYSESLQGRFNARNNKKRPLIHPET